ncbi:MAG TPA: AAA family ATPase [Tepidisphaeraceae bacterium]|nr:AAA family ATPase [Tepidisphaeraceae bacterium]
MDLFADSRKKNRDRVAPLAARMRPRTLDEFAGQQHFLAPGKLLRRMLEADRLMSVIFYGPPGTGKTTLAELIANYSQSHFEHANAASVGVKDVRAILDAARERLETTARRTVLFLDEIHRFNRAQQDILLGDVEAGQIVLVGATTENPFFSVNSALVSRSQIFQFAPLSEDDIIALLKRAIADPERGFGKLDLTIDDDALPHWAITSDGDAHRAGDRDQVVGCVRTHPHHARDRRGKHPAQSDRLRRHRRRALRRRQRPHQEHARQRPRRRGLLDRTDARSG